MLLGNICSTSKMKYASIWQRQKHSPLGHWSVHRFRSGGSSQCWRERPGDSGSRSRCGPRAAGTCRRSSPAALFLLRYVLHSDFPQQAARVRGSALPGESDRSAQPGLFIEGGGLTERMRSASYSSAAGLRTVRGTQEQPPLRPSAQPGKAAAAGRGDSPLDTGAAAARAKGTRPRRSSFPLCPQFNSCSLSGSEGHPTPCSPSKWRWGSHTLAAGVRPRTVVVKLHTRQQLTEEDQEN